MNILVVDDDKYLIEKILNGMDWETLKISDVFQANNIQQAKQIFNTFDVDILLTDIEMPRGSGLELLEWVRENGYNTECICLSSYAHFAYAQKALSLHSKEYLLKPISNKELYKVLKKIIQEIEKKDRPIKKTNTIMEFWKDWVQTKDIKFDEMEKRKDIREYLENNKFSINILAFFSWKMIYNTREQKLLEAKIREEYFKYSDFNRLSLEIIEKNGVNQWVVIYKNIEDEKLFCEKMTELTELLSEELGTELFIYHGRQVPYLRLNESYNTVEKIKKCIIPGVEKVLKEKDLQSLEKKYNPSPLFNVEKGFDNLEQLQLVREKVMRYLQNMVLKRALTVNNFELFRRDLMQMIYLYLKEKELLASQIFQDQEFDNYYENSVKTLKGMKEFIAYIFNQLEGNQTISNKDETIVEQIKRIIDENLEQDLSRTFLAKKVFLSEDYISKIFGQEIGMSLPNYIMQCRMDKAKQYLEQTTLPISNIAVHVGYTNFSYFSRTFKNYTGSTPNEYRNQ